MIISGPTGSGKSTTLYAALQEIKSDNINITTRLERSCGISRFRALIRYKYTMRIGLSFAAALRSILRQDRMYF